MGDKVDYQHGGTADGKTFGSKAPDADRAWGPGCDNRDQAGTGAKPGEAQVPGPFFDPAK